MTPKEEFRDTTIDGAVFEGCSMKRCRFEDVDLSASVFRNATGARLDDVNLSGVVISDANIEGLTILGYDIQALIAAASRA